MIDSAISDPAATGAVPVVFGPPERSLFGFFHPAQGVLKTGGGVVLCNPLGYESMCAHRTYRHMAERLAAAGIAALRFDYDGTGDSAGDFDDVGRLRAWLGSIHLAIEDLCARSGAKSIALFGVRFGATLAAVAAAERSDVDSLVMWAPSPTGQSYVREMRAFRMIKGPAPESFESSGTEEIAGYPFDRGTLEELSAIDLFALKGRLANRVLIVARDDIPGREPRLGRHLETCAEQVQVVTDPGYALMMRDPQDTVVPFGTLNSMVRWLRDDVDGGSQGGPLSRPPPGHPGAPPVRALVTRVNPTGARVQESLVQFGEGRKLFGVVSEPADRPLLPDRPAMVFLNVGANHHVGPNRMYVVLGRLLAARGYRCLRFDIAGLGDSPIAQGAPENRLYSKDSVGDVLDALSFMTSEYGVDRFVLTGLCSGAYLAFHTAIEDRRVVGQVLINPQTFEWREGDTLELSTRKSFLSTRYYARALADYQVWLRVLRGDVNVRGIAGILQERLSARAAARLTALGARLRGQTAPQTELERAFHGLSRRDADSLLIFSFNDGGLDMIEKHLGSDAWKMGRDRHFRFEIVTGADHTFTPILSQRALYTLVTRFVTTLFP